MWCALTTHFFAPPRLEPLGSVPSVTAAGISLLLHSASPVCPEMGEMGTGGADAIILALLRSRHAQRPMSRLRWRSSVLCRWAGTRVFSARHLSIPCLRPALIATTALNAGWVASATGSNRYWACAFPRHPKRFTARTACAALRCSKPLHVLGERQARARADERGVGERR